MTDEDGKPPEGGRKTLVIHGRKSSVTEEDLTKLLIDAGMSEDEVVFIDPREGENAVEFSENDCLIVPLEEATADDDAVERVVLKAAQATCSIIGIWVPGEKDQTIHPAVAKYGSAQVPWDAVKLKDVLTAECPPPYQAPSGAPSKGHDIRPNRCR